MKKLAVVFLCICMLLTALPCCGAVSAGISVQVQAFASLETKDSTNADVASEVDEAGNDQAITDEMIEQMTQMYLNMDIDAYIEMTREYMNEETIESMREMHKMARDGTLGVYLRGGVVPVSNGDTQDKEDEDVWGGGELELYPAYVEVPEGYSIYLDWNTPDGQALEWRSSNAAVATVDADGLITALSAGEAVITASLKNKPEIKAYCGVSVVPLSEEEERENNIVIWEETPPGVKWAETANGLALAWKDGKSGDAKWETGIEIDKGEGKIKIDKRGVRNALKKGYDWTIFLDNKETIRCAPQGHANINHTHTIRIVLKAAKKGGTTPFGVYKGEALYYHEEYKYRDYYDDGFLCIDEDTNLTAGELKKMDQESARHPYYAEGMLFAFTPNHVGLELEEDPPPVPVSPVRPLPSPDLFKGNKSVFHIDDLSMSGDLAYSSESKHTRKYEVATNYGASASPEGGFFTHLYIWIGNNAVEVGLDICSEQDEPVLLTGGRLAKRLRN